MKYIFLNIIFLFLLCATSDCQTHLIKGRIVDDSKAPISNAYIMICTQDSTIVSSGISDSRGMFSVLSDSVRSYLIKVTCLGFCTYWNTLPISDDIVLYTDNLLLSEVVVKGKKNPTKRTASGLIYDLTNISFVKERNVFQVLSLVPFVDVDNSGHIRVNGSKDYEIYLNGKPFDIGMKNPAQILQSFQAKDIKKIEVVTNPDLRFNNYNVPVINIITYPNSLDGIYVNGSVKYQTQPNAATGLSFLAKKNHVDFSTSYNYDYRSQFKQPIDQLVTFGENSTAIAGKGDGEWHTHILRAMTSWRIDSISVIYADFHAKINKSEYTTKWVERSLSNVISSESGQIINRNSAKEGTIEANVIYRNYFRNRPNKEHFMIGYRYTHNPDKRKNAISNTSDSYIPMTQHTSGGVNEHTLNASMNVLFAGRQQINLGARTIYRNANITSTDNSGLSYYQSITYPFLSYMGNFQGIRVSVSLSGEYDYLSMKSVYMAQDGHSSQNFYLLPSVSIYKSFKKWNVNMAYRRDLKRPTIVMLNPFLNSENDYFSQSGNPNLKSETKDLISVGTSYFASGISLSLGLSYVHTADAILSCQRKLSDSENIRSSYDNIGRVSAFVGNVFVNWQPVTPLVIKFNVNGGPYHLSSSEIGLSQNDYTFNLFCWMDYYLPKNWNLGANVMHFKQEPEPFGTVNSITKYSGRVGKSWLNGRLSTSLEISCPFKKYAKLKTLVENISFSTHKVNYMTVRYVGVDVVYTFQRGQKSKLKRDSSLINSDQNNGVL
jgi:hypothetical protein